MHLILTKMTDWIIKCRPLLLNAWAICVIFAEIPLLLLWSELIVIIRVEVLA